ncbi:molybdopterin synthase catalytic subunit [Diabrotica undecimpunctata]|uniref:molybdopterin synthase catalytic subunit n=1 Tax=Diabrotica undecimpunctata TaxID=50387 RepID=UPI003B641F8C
MNYLKLTSEKLSPEVITDLVSSASCGAISLFIGTTRDNFEGKTVETLEYEAYESMGIKCMETICSNIREKWSSVVNIAIYHRLGLVPVKEASIIIGISSPHRADAIKATEFCIDNVKKSVPIWKKEHYKDDTPQWKENKESQTFQVRQSVEVPRVFPHLIQIKASKAEVDSRINKLMERKRYEIDLSNIHEFCPSDRTSEFTCARVDAVVHKRKDGKSHLQVNRVINSYQWRDQISSNYLTKYIPPNGVEERLQNLEEQLTLSTPISKNVYQRLQNLEDRLLYLESISPEYVQFWNKVAVPNGSSTKKKVFTINEIDSLIAEAQRV